MNSFGVKSAKNGTPVTFNLKSKVKNSGVGWDSWFILGFTLEKLVKQVNFVCHLVTFKEMLKWRKL